MAAVKDELRAMVEERVTAVRARDVGSVANWQYDSGEVLTIGDVAQVPL